MIDWVEVGPFIALFVAGCVIAAFNYRRYKRGEKLRYREDKSNAYFDTRYGKQRYTNKVRKDPRG